MSTDDHQDGNLYTRSAKAGKDGTRETRTRELSPQRNCHEKDT
jgi:hypothetical protein